MDAASLLAGRPAAMASDASASAVGVRDARLAPKLVTAAHAFEASLMQELLKPLNRSGALGGDEDDNDAVNGEGLGAPEGGSGGALMSFGSEALASALSEKGGLGIARRILDHFETTNAAEMKANDTEANDWEAERRAGMKTEVRKFQDGTEKRY